jgi:hypothetical protein
MNLCKVLDTSLLLLCNTWTLGYHHSFPWMNQKVFHSFQVCWLQDVITLLHRYIWLYP